jgi:hypothetical protein
MAAKRKAGPAGSGFSEGEWGEGSPLTLYRDDQLTLYRDDQLNRETRSLRTVSSVRPPVARPSAR